MKINIIKQSGFTLIELLIVISIISIFSTMTIINFRGNEKTRDMNNQVLLLLDGIIRMQTSALSGRIIDNKVPTSYLLLVDRCLADCSYNLSASTTIGLIDIDNVALNNSTVDIVDNDGISLGNNLKVEILPPRGKLAIYVDDIWLSTNEVVIKLTHLDNPAIVKKIRINGISGRLDILNN